MALLRRLAVATMAVSLAIPLTGTARAEEASPADVVRVPEVAASTAPKLAVVGSAEDKVGHTFAVIDGSGLPSLTGTLEPVPGDPAPWAHAAVADFSGVPAGTYRVIVDGIESGPVVVQDDPYPALLGSLLGVFDANADGREKSSLHAPSHLHDARSRIRNGPAKGRTIDVAGGWMDAGDQLKFTVTIGYAATLLQLAARNQPARAPRLHAIANVGVRWLLRAHPSDRVFVAQVGDTDADHNRGFRDPTKDDSAKNPLLSRRPSQVLTLTSRGADVAASAATALALAAQRASGHKRVRLVRAAKEWLAEAERLRGPWSNCCYSQDTVKDDLAGAAVELWRATGTPSYRDDALGWLKDVTGNGKRGWRVGMDGYEMAGLPAAELCGVLGARAPESRRVRKAACRILRAGGRDAAYHADRNAFGRAGPIAWGSIRQNQNGSLIALLAGRAGQAGARATSLRALGWFLGANPWGVRFQAGYGVEHPYHWAQRQGPNLPDGAIVGGPASRAVIDANYHGPPITLGPYDTAGAVYRDVRDDYVTNEVGITYSAGSVLLMALLSPS